MRTKLQNVPVGDAFMFPQSTLVFEHRGNGWHQIYRETETGGPWHAPAETDVDYEPAVQHPQNVSCFV
jgi:hypothetical protein